jgi:hypothetical protein
MSEEINLTKKEIDKDRVEVCEAISRMLDFPDENGIYPTTACFNRLVGYIQGIRFETLGFAHAEACSCLDKGGDPRKTETFELIENYEKAFELKKEIVT